MKLSNKNRKTCESFTHNISLQIETYSKLISNLFKEDFEQKKKRNFQTVASIPSHIIIMETKKYFFSIGGFVTDTSTQQNVCKIRK